MIHCCAGLVEIHDWLVADSHKEDFILLHINDEGQKLDWGHIELVQKPVQSIFGDVLFTPLDKKKDYPNRWYVYPCIICNAPPWYCRLIL